MKQLFLSIVLLLPVGLKAVGQLPLPEVPDSLTTTTERADYVACHFFDRMDWSDASMTSEVALTQSWVDFLSILPYTSGYVANAAIDSFLKSVPHNFLNTYSDLTETYLLAADSPCVDEGLYTSAVNAMANRPDISPAEQTAHLARLKFLEPNAPGSFASDFTFPLPDGSETHLSDMVGRTPYLLIVFNDPDCDVCHEVIDHISTDPQWVALTSSGRLTIITPEITPELDEAYPMVYIPSLYLLDSEGEVIVRNELPDAILRHSLPAP